MLGPLVIENVVIPRAELVVSAVRASGPGGQNVNKVASKVELRFAFENSSALPAEVKARLRVLAAGRLDADGSILITSQLTRNQPQNQDDARAKLAALIAQALIKPKRRKPSRPSRAAKARRMTDKRQNAEKKQGRGRVGFD